MHLSVSHSRHALRASLVPPAVGECGAQVSVVFRAAVAVSPEVTVAVVGCSAAASGPWLNEIAEAAPCDADVVGTVHTVEVAVHTILEVTVVHPDVLRTGNGEIVVAVDVVGSGALEGEVAQDDVLA